MIEIEFGFIVLSQFYVSNSYTHTHKQNPLLTQTASMFTTISLLLNAQLYHEIVDPKIDSCGILGFDVYENAKTFYVQMKKKKLK